MEPGRVLYSPIYANIDGLQPGASGNISIAIAGPCSFGVKIDYTKEGAVLPIQL